MSAHLLEEVKKVEALFTVETQTLKRITEDFVVELAKGWMLLKE